MKRIISRVLLLILLGSLIPSIGLAQEGEAETLSLQPSDQGTPGLVNTLGNLNLCPQALAGTPANGCPAPAAPPPIVPRQGPPQPPTAPIQVPSCGNAAIATFMRYQEGFDYDDCFHVGNLYALSTGMKIWQLDGKALGSLFVTGAQAGRAFQQSDLLYTYTHAETGQTVNVYTDYRFQLDDEGGAVLLAGYLGIVGDDTVVAYGDDEAQNRYAFMFYEPYYSAVNAEGDFILGNAFTAYRLDFDENGKVLSLRDIDGGEYDVQLEEDGSAWISGSDGYEVYADDSGAFELYDEAGELVVEGNLFDDTDDFAAFDDSSDDDERSDDAAADESTPADDEERSGDQSAADDSGGDGS